METLAQVAGYNLAVFSSFLDISFKRSQFML